MHVPGGDVTDYRDFTVLLADDDPQIGQDFMPYPTNARAGLSLLNYAAAPAGDGPGAFRDPGQVPLLTAYAGDPEAVHVLDDARQRERPRLQPRWAAVARRTRTPTTPTR